MRRRVDDLARSGRVDEGGVEEPRGELVRQDARDGGVDRRLVHEARRDGLGGARVMQEESHSGAVAHVPAAG